MSQNNRHTDPRGKVGLYNFATRKPNAEERASDRQPLLFRASPSTASKGSPMPHRSILRGTPHDIGSHGEVVSSIFIKISKLPHISTYCIRPLSDCDLAGVMNRCLTNANLPSALLSTTSTVDRLARSKVGRVLRTPSHIYNCLSSLLTSIP